MTRPRGTDMSDNTTIDANGVKIPAFSSDQDALEWAMQRFAPPPAPKAPPAPIALPAPPPSLARDAFRPLLQKYHRVRATHKNQVDELVAALGAGDDVVKLT